MTDINDVASAFMFTPGPHEYIVEVKADSDVTMDNLAYLTNDFRKHNIHVNFIMTHGDGFKINAVPVIIEPKE